VVAIGIFDGVHLGHQAILRKAISRARALGALPVAATFYPHPCAVLSPRRLPPLILSLEERLKLFENLGIRAALVIPFTRAFSRWSPERFVKQLLVAKLGVQEVVVGHDFGFGKGRSGSVRTLKALGEVFGFKVHVVGPVKRAGKRISSRRLRTLIHHGHLREATACLGRSPQVIGHVVHGEGRGARLGFSTANLKIEAGVLPPVGVYAVRAQIQKRYQGQKSVPGTKPGNRYLVPKARNGTWYPGMADLGFKPTFHRRGFKGTGEPHLEVHLFGMHNSLYGNKLQVEFIKRLRSERRFPSAEALVRQLTRDAASTRRILRRG